MSSIINQIYQDTSVMVTGGCGFIGSHLVEALVRYDARVTVIDNMQAGQLHNLAAVKQSVHVIEGDVRDRQVMERVVQEEYPQFVFHLAANASVPGSVDEPLYDFETNCGGTFVLLNALRATKCCKSVVVASSGAVYGEPGSFPIVENDALQPISPYGASKLSAEIEARMFHTVYNVPVVMARLFNSYGPRMSRFVILDFLRKLQNNPRVLEVLGNGQQVRDFTFVSDTVDGLLLALARGKAGEAYNISSGVTCSVTQLAHAMISILGLTNETEIAYTGKSWIGDAQHWEVSIEKMRSLGYHPSVLLEQGIEQTIAWFVDTYGPVIRDRQQ